MVISSPAPTAVLASGSVLITWSTATVESGFCSRRVLKPAFCSATTASADAWPRTSGTCTSRVLPPIMLIAMVTTTVSTASTATAISHRPTDWPRSRSPYRGCETAGARSAGSGPCGPVEANSEVRSASVSTFGASGASPLCTRIRSARISAAVW